MFEQLFQRETTVQRYRAGPLVHSRLRYLEYCGTQGYARSSLQGTANQQLALARFLKAGDDDSVCLSQIEAAAGLWVEELPEHRRSMLQWRRQLVATAVRWLGFTGQLQESSAPAVPHITRLEQFAASQSGDRGLSEATVKLRCRLTREFLLQCSGLEFESIGLPDIEHALGKAAARGCGRSTIGLYASSLRAFFRHAEERGWRPPGLAALIASPRVATDERLPVGPAWEDVQRLIAAASGPEPADRRDRAILLLLAVYGLRSGEIRQLRLDDINWEAETLRVRRPKPGRTHCYPLTDALAVALMHYLREVRPAAHACREVFLTLRSPSRPLSKDALGQVVTRRLRRLGVVCRHRGPHGLRHACAQRLLDQGLSMKAVGDCLGHRSAASTAVYVKVDLQRLRQVADFDLEGLA